MSSYLVSDKPIIYADMNVYRYLACGDISIRDPERFIWVYSTVHLDEIYRNGNKDALKGMEMLRAVEICDVLNEQFQSVGDVVLRAYLDPYVRYEQHLNAIAGFEGVADHLVEYLLHFFGADNYKELSDSPKKLLEEMDRITRDLDDELRQHLIERSSVVSLEAKGIIEKHLKDCMPIEKTRKAFGITSEYRKAIEKSQLAIDKIWELVSSTVPNLTKDQFFGFESPIKESGIQHTQHGAISSAHLVLNMVGVNPDRGLANREKIKNIISDGQHVGMASYCHTLVSADRGIIRKAYCIYSYLKNDTSALHFECEYGYELHLNSSQSI